MPPPNPSHARRTAYTHSSAGYVLNASIVPGADGGPCVELTCDAPGERAVGHTLTPTEFRKLARLIVRELDGPAE